MNMMKAERCVTHRSYIYKGRWLMFTVNIHIVHLAQFTPFNNLLF